MDVDKLKVKLNSSEGTYYAGQELKGDLIINLIKRTKIRGILGTIHGYGKCSWYDLIRRDSHNALYIPKGTQRPLFYSGHITYIQHEEYIVGSKTARPMELEPGSYTFPFTYNLPKTLPSSFLGAHGYIKYKLKFVVDKPWSFDEKCTVPFTIIKLQPLPDFSESVLRQMTKNIGVFGGGPISLVAELPVGGVARGEKFNLRVVVENRSNIYIDRLKFYIKQCVLYTSQKPLSMQKMETIKVFKKETGGIQKKSERTFDYELHVPHVQPTDHDNGKIISIFYNVQVDTVLPGLYKNISVALPFTIYSHQAEVNRQAQNSSLQFPNENISLSASWLSSDPSIPRPPQCSDHFVTNCMQSILGMRGIYSSSTTCSPPADFPESYSLLGSGTLQRGTSNRSSIISISSLASSSQSSASSPPAVLRHLEDPPSYDDLFGGRSPVPENKPSAPSLNIIRN